MSAFDIFAILITLTAIFGYLNERFIKLPTPIGVTLVALLFSLGLLLFNNEAVNLWGTDFLESLNFNELVMQGMLSFLLFAGSLHVDLNDLRKQKWIILILASLGVIISTFIVGSLIYLILPLLGLHLPYLYALLFGALISPTDPIAVLALLRKIGVRKNIETLFTGESLFNDGVGIVVFTVILGLLGTDAHGASIGFGSTITLFAQEALGGLLFGLVIGLIAYYMLRDVEDYTIEVLITLALVAGGYALALTLHTSGPLAMVVAGLFIGNRGRDFAMSEKIRERLDTFWEMLDEILNAVLFVLIGLELLAITYSVPYILATLIAIPVVLVARFICVGLPITIFRRIKNFPPYTVRVMVWGGLRGGISIALALSLMHGTERDIILTMTYGVVVFAILVQGLTVGRLAKRIPQEA